MKELSGELKDIKANSDYTRDKLNQVETGMEGMNLPAYSAAILDLAKKVENALGPVRTIENTEPNSNYQSNDGRLAKTASIIEHEQVNSVPLYQSCQIF